MDPRLFEAATTGNVGCLRLLMREKMLLLDTVALAGAETPLHIASMRGHLPFVQEMLKLRKQFAYELNQDGFTPLHLASANGHLQIAIELLKVDQDHSLCGIKGRGETLPIHCAAVKGRIDIMEELLSGSPTWVGNKTARGETPLHIAVKNNQFDAFKLLVKHVKTFKKEQACTILNEKDNQGNTILHLAASKKQYEVVQFLLVDDDITKEMVKVNSLNEIGMTPLDDLLQFQSEAGDAEIQTALLKAGAKKGKDMDMSSSDPDPPHNTCNEVPKSNTLIITTEKTNENQPCPPNKSTKQSTLPARIRYWPRMEEMAELFGYKTNRDSANDVRSALLTVAILMATATYQAVLSPPGGLWQESKNDQIAGKAIMGSKNEVTFFMFMIGNSMGFFSSLYMISFLTIGFPMQSQLLLSLFAISFTYCSSMYSISPGNASDRTVFYVFVIFAYLLPYMPHVVRILFSFCRRRASVHSAP